VDGDDTDWREPMMYDEKSQLLVGVKNDDKYMYVCIKTADDAAIRKIMTVGLSLWFNNEGSKNQSFGLNFPMGMINATHPIPGLIDKDTNNRLAMPPRDRDMHDPKGMPNEEMKGMPHDKDGDKRPPMDQSFARRDGKDDKDSLPPDMPFNTDRRPGMPGKPDMERPDLLKNARIFIEKNRNQIGITRTDLESKYKIRTAINQKGKFLIYEIAIPLEKSEFFDLSLKSDRKIGFGITSPEMKRPERKEHPSEGDEPKAGGMPGGGGIPGGVGMTGGGGMKGGGGHRGGGMRGGGGHRGGGEGAPEGGGMEQQKELTEPIELWYEVKLTR
jgi:hypothetical protein